MQDYLRKALYSQTIASLGFTLSGFLCIFAKTFSYAKTKILLLLSKSDNRLLG